MSDTCIATGCTQQAEWRPVLTLDPEDPVPGSAPLRVLFDVVCCTTHRLHVANELASVPAPHRTLILNMLAASKTFVPDWDSASVGFIPKDSPESMSFKQAVHRGKH